MNRLGIAAILVAMAIGSGAAFAQVSDMGPSGENPLGGPASALDESAPAATATVSMTKAQSMLAAQGYTGVTGLKRRGGAYVGQALKNGKSVAVKVNAQTGLVTAGAVTAGAATPGAGIAE